MFQKRGAWSLLTLLAGLALVIGACTTPSGPSTTTPTDQLDPSGELTTNTGSEPDTIDPQKESFVNEVAQTMMVYEALMNFDPKTLKPIPAAAKDQPKLSADGLKYSYTLRDGLKYSDGTPVTAKDFAYGFTRLCDPATHGEYAFTGYVIVGCEAWNTMDPKKATPAELTAAKGKLGIKVVSDKEIEFTLTESAPYFNSIAALWVGAPVRESDVTKGGEKWTEPATFIGNGPFKLVEWKHNEKMVYERNDNYRTPAKLKRWTKQMINEGAVAFAAYRNNELDMVGVATEDLRSVDADPDLKAQLVEVDGSCTTYIGFNNSRAPFDDPKVRLAFAKSIDREAFTRDIDKISKPALSFIPPGMPGYDAGDQAQKFDAAAAKKTLSESKYFGKPELQNIKITYSASARSKVRLEWAQGQWKTNLGVDVALDPVDSTTFSQLVKSPATVPLMFRLGWCADYPDQQDWLTTVFHSSSTVTRVGFKNAQFDKLTRDADKEVDAKKRDDLYQQASRLLSSEAGVAFLNYSASKFLKKPWVKNLVSTSMDFEYGIFNLSALGVTAKK